MKDQRTIAAVFERFLRERIAFAGSVGDLSRHDSNAELLRAAGAVPLLGALLSDPMPGVRCSAATALGRLATQSDAVATLLVADGAVKTLVNMIAAPRGEDASKRREQAAQRRAAAICLRGIAKHGVVNARAVAAAGGLQAVVDCLQHGDGDTREATAWMVDCMAGHHPELGEAAVQAGVLAPLVSCLDCSEVATKRGAAAALGSIAQHGDALAHAVAEAGAVPKLTAILGADIADVRLARCVLCALGLVAQGGPDVATAIVTGGALPQIVQSLGAGDELVQRYAAAALRDVARHGDELAATVAATPGCLQMLVASTSQAKGLNQLAGTMALGHLCSFTAALAEAVITWGGLAVLTPVLAASGIEPVQCAAAWAVGQAGRHGASHAQAVGESGALLALASIEISPQASPDLAAKCCKAASSVVAQLASLPALDALFRMQISVALKAATLDRLAAVLSQDAANKAAFVQSGGLQAVQELGEEEGSPFRAEAARIAELYPKEVANRYSPTYNRQLLERLALGGVGRPPVTAAPPPPPPPPPPAERDAAAADRDVLVLSAVDPTPVLEIMETKLSPAPSPRSLAAASSLLRMKATAEDAGDAALPSHGGCAGVRRSSAKSSAATLEIAVDTALASDTDSGAGN